MNKFFIIALLGLSLTNGIKIGEEPENTEALTLEQFKQNLETYVEGLPRPITISNAIETYR